MFKGVKVFLVVCITIIPFIFSSCGHARPPKPGPNFIWINAHTAPDGIVISGHWKYKGPVKRGKAWVPRHRAPDGTWIQGHWRAVPRPKGGAKWISGHNGPRGRWVPGHWR